MAEPMRPLYDFLPMLRVEAPGVPNPLAIQYLRLAAKDFCKRTRNWRHTITVEMDADGNESVVAPANSVVFEIENAHFGDDRIPLEPLAYTSVDPDYFVPDPDNTGTPMYVTMKGRNTITILPYAEGTLHLSVFLHPLAGPEDTLRPDAGPVDYEAINSVPAFLFTDHADVIIAGALAKLLQVPQTKFQDPGRAQSFAMMYEANIVPELHANISGKASAVKRAKPEWF